MAASLVTLVPGGLRSTHWHDAAGMLPFSVLLQTPCSCSCGSETLWGWHTTSWSVLRCLVPLMMLLTMHQPHLYQPWRQDRRNPFIHCAEWAYVLNGTCRYEAETRQARLSC